MQKKAVRIVTKSKKLDPTGPLFEEIDVLPFEKLCFKRPCDKLDFPGRFIF